MVDKAFLFYFSGFVIYWPKTWKALFHISFLFCCMSFVSFLASWSDQHLFCLFWNTLYKQGIKWPSKEELFESRKGKEDRQKQLPSLSSLLKHVLRRIADFSSCIQNIFLRAAHTNTTTEPTRATIIRLIRTKHSNPQPIPARLSLLHVLNTT